MRRFGWAACCVGVSLTVVLGSTQAQGPGGDGAGFRNPFDPVAPARPAVPTSPSALEKSFGKSLTTPMPTSHDTVFTESNPGPGDGRPKGLAALKPSPKDDLNKDIAVQAGNGAWLISVMSYVGPESPTMAREFVMELRSKYRMDAWVFNHGAEERRKEYERVKELFDKQKKFCEDNRLPVDKIRIRYTYTPDQCAVLVGGYASDDAARRDLDRIRKLPPPDPSKVKLDQRVVAQYDLIEGKSPLLKGYKPPKEANEYKINWINPFQRAFVVRNPAIKTERAAEPEMPDLATLNKLNRGEPYNLLDCRKPLTLAITHFRTPTALDEAPSGGGILGGVLGTKKKQREDYAAANANLLADNLRKHFKLDAYVLHTRYSSIVTVGGFDSPEDPNMRSMKNLLQTRLRIPAVELFPEPYLMRVPR